MKQLPGVFFLLIKETQEDKDTSKRPKWENKILKNIEGIRKWKHNILYTDQ